MTTERKYFGTDGIRGTVGEGPITADFVMRLGWAVGKVFGAQAEGRKLVLIGKDTRVSGYMFESALQAGLIAAGVDVGLLGPMPTPAIAYLTRTFHAQAGIVISASHNPFQDNGIKFFGADGYKLPDEVELEIERYLDEPMMTEQSSELGRAERISDAAGRYIEFCKGVLPRDLSFTGMRIVVDCANGATYHIAPNVLKELGAEVIELAVEPNGVNINLNCGSTKPVELQRAVVEQGADLGVAFDGDGDRLVFVDHRGELVDGDEILYIIANHRQQTGQGCSGVAGTLMSNFGLEKAFQQMEVPFQRAKVGDRYVIETMKKQGWTLGGENSGHIVCSDVTTTGDGIVSALLVLHALHDSSDNNLHQLKKGMSKYPQTMINVRIDQKVELADYPDIAAAVAEAETELADSGRVLLRPSGTEPLIRVMVEGEDKQQVDRLAQQVADAVQKTLAPEEV